MFIEKLTNGECLVNYDPDINCIEMNWEGYSTSEEFRATNEKVLSFFVTKNADKILADASDLLIIDTRDQEWLSYNWIPRAVKLGFTSCAMIKPKHHFNKIAIQNIVKQVDEQLSIVFFTNKQQAKDWLMNRSSI